MALPTQAARKVLTVSCCLDFFGEQIKDSRPLCLVHVDVAFWVLTSEDSLWFLYVASPVVDSEGLAAAYRKAYSELSRSQVRLVSRSDIKLIGSQNPIAVDALAHQRDNLPTRYGGRRLGNIIVEDAYIYPR